ncbi:MAG TPA: GNAT family protein [Longimicrobium sp.]|nr:GNAT family protein [Longimicrobium sp.]
MPAVLLGTPYRIVTPSIVLRCWEPCDASTLHRLIADNLEHLRPWVSWAANEPKPLAARLAEVRQWRAAFDLDHLWQWAILSADDGELVGGVVMNRMPDGATVDTGVWVEMARTRRGLGTESMAVLARMAFELMGMTRVQAATDPANERSNALLRKLGYVHEATTRHLEHGVRKDELLWSILADEWPATFAAEVASEARAFDALGNRLF